LKAEIEKLVAAAVATLPGAADHPELRDMRPEIERTRDPGHGDFACNAAMQLARPLKTAPREIARAIAERLPPSSLLDGVEIAGPGFLNFRLSESAYHDELRKVLERAGDYGSTGTAAGRRVIVEYVSANPTGPLHVGHGRHAAYGDSVSRLLAATGHDVHREYYVNDAGRQMDILALSFFLRLPDIAAHDPVFPSGGYRGEYITAIAAGATEEIRRDASAVDVADLYADLPADGPEGDADAHLDALIDRLRTLLGEKAFRRLLQHAGNAILRDIRDDLDEFGVRPDRWFSEQSLVDEGAVGRALKRVAAAGKTYQRDGATWFRATDYGDEKDRVVVRENGRTTYFASDIAYHLHKRERGFDLLLDILGADHHGYVARVRAGLEAMGELPESLEVDLVQFVVLYRGSEKIAMSTRSGDFVTLRTLRGEVGNDAARLFFVMRSNDQHLDFDLELAKSRSNDNPVYYIQYAHARICSVMTELKSRGRLYDETMAVDNLSRLTETHERSLMQMISRFPEVIELAARQRAPQHLVHYLRDLAHELHTYYNAHRFIVDDEGLSNARLLLVLATRQVLRNGLGLVGVSAPDTM